MRFPKLSHNENNELDIIPSAPFCILKKLYALESSLILKYSYKLASNALLLLILKGKVLI